MSKENIAALLPEVTKDKRVAEWVRYFAFGTAWAQHNIAETAMYSREALRGQVLETIRAGGLNTVQFAALQCLVNLLEMSTPEEVHCARPGYVFVDFDPGGWGGDSSGYGDGFGVGFDGGDFIEGSGTGWSGSGGFGGFGGE